jgi:HSP20 family protein
MTLTTYAPIHNLSRVFDSLMDYAKNEQPQNYTQNPRSFLTEDKEGYKLEIELPGVRKEDTKVNVEGTVLKVSAIRKRGEDEFRYEREFHLSEEVDTANIQASSENGILTLALQRKPETLSKQIAIQ